MPNPKRCPSYSKPWGSSYSLQCRLSEGHTGDHLCDPEQPISGPDPFGDQGQPAEPEATEPPPLQCPVAGSNPSDLSIPLRCYRDRYHPGEHVFLLSRGPSIEVLGLVNQHGGEMLLRLSKISVIDRFNSSISFIVEGKTGEVLLNSTGEAERAFTVIKAPLFRGGDAAGMGGE